MAELSAEAVAALEQQGREAREAREAVTVTEAMSGMSDREKEWMADAAAYDKQTLASFIENGGKPPKGLK